MNKNYARSQWKHFSQLPKGKIKWNGKSFVKPNQSNAFNARICTIPCSLRRPLVFLLPQTAHWNKRVKRIMVLLKNQVNSHCLTLMNPQSLRSSSKWVLQHWFSQNLRVKPFSVVLVKMESFKLLLESRREMMLFPWSHYWATLKAQWFML